MEKNNLFWITGLAGSGKTTLASSLYTELKSRHKKVILLDGDSLREIFQEETDYSREGRLKIAWRNARLCKFLVDQGITVVCATISLFHEIQDWNRRNIQGYCEIFLDTPMEVLIERDQKGLYSGSKGGHLKNVVGLDIPAEFPLKPHIHVSAQDKIELILSNILDKKYD